MPPLPALIFIVVVLVLLFRRLQVDFMTGLEFGILLLVCLPTALRIELPGILPDLTIHRMILLTLFFFWLKRPEAERCHTPSPFLGAFVAWCVINFVSLLTTSISYSTGSKRFLDAVMEFLLFFIMASRAVRHEDDALRVLKAAWKGILIVGVLAVLEKYTGFNPVDRFIPTYARDEGTYADVLSTYPHRILLGTGMAMGWPIAFALLAARRGGLPMKGWLLWISVMILMTGCYFGMSRGPWIASIFVLLGLIVLGTQALRARLLLIGALAGMVMMARPGVAESILGLVGSTTQTGTQKEGTFKYRLELWRVAWSEISKNPLRTVLGYGPGAGLEMEVEWELSYRGTERKIESWDNNFAYDLLQTGVLGFLATLVLFIKPILVLTRYQRSAEGWRKDCLAGVVCCVLAMVFMMTNVLIFAKQLHFLFWTAAVAGMKIGVPAFLEDEVEIVDHGEEIPANHSYVSPS